MTNYLMTGKISYVHNLYNQKRIQQPPSDYDDQEIEPGECMTNRRTGGRADGRTSKSL